MSPLPSALPTFSVPPTALAAAPPQGEDSVGVFVEITPNDTVCTVDCPVEPTPVPALPATGGEALSLVVPAALLLAGVAATVWSRRKTAGAHD